MGENPSGLRSFVRAAERLLPWLNLAVLLLPIVLLAGELVSAAGELSLSLQRPDIAELETPGRRQAPVERATVRSVAVEQPPPMADDSQEGVPEPPLEPAKAPAPIRERGEPPPSPTPLLGYGL